MLSYQTNKINDVTKLQLLRDNHRFLKNFLIKLSQKLVNTKTIWCTRGNIIFVYEKQFFLYVSQEYCCENKEYIYVIFLKQCVIIYSVNVTHGFLTSNIYTAIKILL